MPQTPCSSYRPGVEASGIFDYTASMIKQLFLFLFWLLTVAGFGCTNESPWDKSMTEVKEAIERHEYAHAEDLLLGALPQAKMWGESDQRFATVLYNLGEIYRRQQEFEKAEPYFWRALPIWAKSVGAEHPEMAKGLTSLTKIYASKQEYTKAEPLIKQALKIQEKNFGLEHTNLLPILEEYSNLLKLMNRQERAGKIDRRIKSILGH